MTVKELKEELNKYPEDLKIGVYCQMSEDSDKAHSVKLYTKEEGPYNKGDDVWDIYDYPDDEKILFIQ